MIMDSKKLSILTDQEFHERVLDTFMKQKRHKTAYDLFCDKYRDSIKKEIIEKNKNLNRKEIFSQIVKNLREKWKEIENTDEGKELKIFSESKNEVCDMCDI